MPLVLFGLIAAVGLCAGDVSHLPLNENAREINQLAAAASANQETFWWMNSNSPLARATNSYQSAPSDKSIAQVHTHPGPQKIDLSHNPFFNGGIAGGVHAGERGVECQGDGYICVRRSECVNGVINNDGFGLIQVRSQVSYCNAKTEVCCRYKEHDYVTGGKSSVHKLPSSPKLDVTNLGETGADVNRLGGSSTSKPTRDAPFVGSTIDYSNTHFEDVRFASTIRGPAYLPPVDETRPRPSTQPPPIEVPRCGPNQYLANGRCNDRPTPPPPPPRPQCGFDEQFVNGRCVPKPRPIECPPNTYLAGGQCIPRPTQPPAPTCPYGQQFIGGSCQCTGNTILQNGVCVPRPTPPPRCPPGQQNIGGRCVPPPTQPPLRCNYNEQLINGRCVPIPTPAPPVTQPTYLPPAPPSCGPNEYLQNGRCVPRPTPSPPIVRCNYNEQLVNGQCVLRPTPPPPTPPPVICNYNEQLINGRCVPKPTPPPVFCAPGQQLINGVCQIVCTGNTILQGGRCVPRATPPPPITHKPTYLPPAITCGPNQYQQNGQCFNRQTPPPPPRCAPGQQLIGGVCQCVGNTIYQNGQCVPRPTPPPRPPTISCAPGQQLIGGVCQCVGNTIYQNGQCVPRPTPPPRPPTISCAPGQQLIGGVCQCVGNTIYQNGQCIPRPTPPPRPPTISCAPGQQLIGGVCQCTGNTIYQNGQCVPRPTPPPYRPDESRNPCSSNQLFQNGNCISCASNEILQNGRCIPRATPPPPTKPSQYLPPVSCSYNEVLQNGRCVPKPTPPPPPICTGNTYLQNGVCVPRPTPPQPRCGPNQYLQNGVCVTRPTPPTRPQTSPGYQYPKPTPSFTLPTQRSPESEGQSSVLENIYIRTTTTTERPDNIPSSNSDNPTFINPTRNEPGPVLPSCAAALKCVQEIYCTAEGFVSPVPVVFTKEQELSRVPLTDCADQEAGIVGKCCRDADYQDPWPSANLVNGIDNGQYREDPSLGQYSGDLRNNRLTRSNHQNQRQDAQQCGQRHHDAQPRGPGSLDAHFAEIPWQAMILRDSNRSLLCGGAIIRKNAVLTSAHCVDGLDAGDVLIKGGEWKLGIDEEPLPFQIVKVKRIITHPLFDRENLHNDVAVLLLDEKLRFTKNIGSICLPPAGEQPAPVGNCIVTGWGKKVLQIHLKDAIMRSVDVDIVSQEECRNHLDAYFPGLSSRLGSSSFCAKSTADQCKVDHGSAIACSADNVHYTLHGIFSWDTSCKDEKQVGAFVQPDVEWIESVLTPKGRRY